MTEGQETKGEAPTDVIYDDSDFDQVANIKPTALHRNVDLAVFQADKEGTFTHRVTRCQRIDGRVLA